jgi:putative chitinase|tara:strand:- start:3823 stop:4419 length:597 start_codon:yes stop_codon:yes gene_type:complete
MTADQLEAMHIDAKWLVPLDSCFFRFDISTPERQAAFIGQCQHESGNFRTLRENLNYGAKGLRATWPSRFPTDESAEPYHRKPELIANKVYSDRMGNGPEESGDGWKFSGRGLIQLTGKANYMAASDSLMVDLISDPDLVLSPEYASLTAAWFWDRNRLNTEADAKDYEKMTRKINGGTIGLADRIKHIEDALKILSA